MSDSEGFTIVTSSSDHKVFSDWEAINGATGFNPDTALQAAIRRQNPGLALTVTTNGNVALLQFAAAGHATADLDIVDECVQRYRYFYAGSARRGIPDQLVESRTFAKYLYKWGTEYFIVYIVQMGYQQVQYILKEPAEGESTMSRNSVTDNLIATIGDWQKPADERFIYVYDRVWQESRDLYEQVRKAEWKDVILNEEMKTTITQLMHKFFDSEDIYKDLGVPWKRGVIFHGPAGNGKTISIEALMHSLFEKYKDSIPSLYVKSAPQIWDIRNIFQMARYQAPSLLIFEDIDTIVTQNSRSYFFNEVDGLENNDGIFMVASTNHLDQLDPGLSSRPSRFDRKYLFPLPSEAERVMYCDYWRCEKLKTSPSIKFPKKLSSAIAGITQGFSFAYLKEAFVATLLVIAGKRSEDGVRGGGDDEGGDWDDYELWREMKIQVSLLRDDMDTSGVRYHLQEPMDLAWRAQANTQSPTTTAPTSPDDALSNLPFRPGANRAARNLNNPRLTTTDCDSRHAPLMTDGGLFVDSRFDGISSARVF